MPNVSKTCLCIHGNVQVSLKTMASPKAAIAALERFFMLGIPSLWVDKNEYNWKAYKQNGRALGTQRWTGIHTPMEGTESQWNQTQPSE